MKFSLSPKMKKILHDCHQNELKGREPCNPITHEFANDLIIHGLLDLKSYTYKNGERKAAYFITEKGRKFIKEQM